MKPIKEVTALVIDTGIFVDLAVRLARDCKKVYYCAVDCEPFPTMSRAFIGHGLENIEVVLSPFGPWLDDADMVCFFDVGMGPLQVWLEAQGKLVFGSRMGEELEMERDATKMLMKRLGLPVNSWEKIKGIDALREYLKANTRQWVKVIRYRGVTEAFFSEQYSDVEHRLNKLAYDLGPLAGLVEFTVEDELPDRVEVGMDLWTVDGQYPKKCIGGCEIKDSCYCAKFQNYADFPQECRDFQEKISPTLRRYGYRGFLSTEIRIGKDRKPYMIDACCRAGSPPSELYCEMYANFSDIVWAAANGEMIDAIPAAKFGAEVIIKSSWEERDSQPIRFPAKYRNNIKLKNACRVDGKYYIIPQTYSMAEIGAVVGMGDTMDAAIEQVKEIAATVKGDCIKVCTAAFDEADDELAEARELGVSPLGGNKNQDKG